jgi:6-phosphogluconolactonase (cycloisomerase 2 family)
LESTAALPGTGTLPAEMGVSVDNRFLYTLNGNGSINAYHINSFDGDLISASKISGLPTTINGLAVR